MTKCLLRHTIITTIWAGNKNEYALYKEVNQIDNCIYIDNYEGPVRAIRGWKNLNRNVIESTFQIKFIDKYIDELGGFPDNFTCTGIE